MSARLHHRRLLLIKRHNHHQRTNLNLILTLMKAFTILTALLVCILAITSCNTLQRDDAKDTLKAISIQIAEAATKAGAEVALKAAEDKLDKLKAEPVPASPIAAALRASAIEEAEKLVSQAREKVNAFRFSDRGIK